MSNLKKPIKGKFKMKLILILAGVFLTGVTAIVQYFEENKNKIENRETQKKLNSKITELQEDNIMLSKQLTKTSLKLNNSIMGSEESVLSLIFNQNNEFLINITNTGVYPIYDAYVVITNYNELSKNDIVEDKFLNTDLIKQKDKKVFLKSKSFKKSTYQEINMNLNPQVTITLGKKFKVNSGNLNFTVNFFSRNKQIMTQYVFVPDNENYIKSYRKFIIGNDILTFVNEEINSELSKEYWKTHFFGNRKTMFVKE